MLCFMDLLNHEMQFSGINLNHLKDLHSFIDNNEYDTESLIDDILCASKEQNISNIGTNMMLKGKYNEYETLKKIVCKYNEPSQKTQRKICKLENVLDVHKCKYISSIIDALNQFHANNIETVSISHLLAAYDHIVSVHRFCNSNTEEKEEKLSKGYDEIEHLQHISEVQQHIVQELGGWCTIKQCFILKKHIMRQREMLIEDTTNDNKEDDSLSEILNATFNALHCYILHKKKELFRLKRENGGNHFVTSVIDEDEVENYVSEKQNVVETKSNTIPNLKFGQSVLNWLNYQEQPTFNSFRDEITQNPESTINMEAYLNYSQECFIKMNNRKHEQYLLQELMSLKMYTDTNSFQSSLRRAFWKSSTKKIKKSFYQWAFLLYKTFLFHAKPITGFTRQSKTPAKLYHGLNKVFVLADARPKYNGLTSTSLQESVAHSFSEGIGLLMIIKSSYANKFKFITGIAVDWISQHKNEAEVLLVDQYLPIASTYNFDNEPKNNVDHLMYTIKSYQKDILYAQQFYEILGKAFNESWIPFIETHPTLHDSIARNPERCVLDVLAEDLRIKQMYNLYIKQKILASQFELMKMYKIFEYCSVKIRINNKCNHINCAEMFENTEFKLVNEQDSNELVFNYNQVLLLSINGLIDKTYKILVKNETLFGINECVTLSSLNIDMSYTKNPDHCIKNHLYMPTTKIISLKKAFKDILGCKFVLRYREPKKILQFTEQDILKGEPYIYQFSNINEIYFIIPVEYRKGTVDIYVQFEDTLNFVLLATFPANSDAGIFSFSKRSKKTLLTCPDGTLFHQLLLAHVSIYLQNQDLGAKKTEGNNDEKCDNNDKNSNKQPDSTAVLLTLLTILPQISHEKLEDNCIVSDLLQFLKIVCHQFTNNILTIGDQACIAFYEPHLPTPDSLPTVTHSNKHKGKNKKNKSNRRLSFLRKRTDNNNNKNMLSFQEFVMGGEYNKNDNKNRKDDDTLSVALKRGRIVQHLTAHPSKAPFGALLSAFEHLLESSNKEIIKSRIDVLN
eukprot:44210_1